VTRRAWSWCCLLLACLAIFASPRAEATAIVVFYGQEWRTQSAGVLDQTLRDEIGERREGDDIKYYSEFVNSTRFPGPEHEQRLADFLRARYADVKVDVIVVMDPSTARFLVRHRDGMFPGTPVAFAGLREETLERLQPPADFVGTTYKLDLRATVDLALRLRPNPSELVIVTGTAELDRSIEEGLKAAAAAAAPTIKTRVLTGLSLDAIVAEVSKLPRDAVVITGSFGRDGAGQFFPSSSALIERLRAVSPVPMVHTYETGVGRGSLASISAPVSSIPRQVALVAKQLLEGVAPAAVVLPQPTSPVTFVDWREMKRWGIPESRLPPGTVTRFREPTFWEQYWATVLGVAAIVLAQAILIALLLIQRSHRRRAELDAQRQHSQLAHAARLATVGELTASIAHEINQPLGAILSNADAAEILLERATPNLSEVRQILADIKRDDERASAVIQRLRALLARHELERHRLDPNTVVREAIALISREAERRGTRVVESLPSQVPPVQGDRVHLVQVLIVLLINAIDAMDAVPAARRRITVSSALAGDKVEITVKDAGPGIPAGDLSRLFDSFFTTKAKGMGLGLSIARSIVEAHGGRIWAENSTDGGAVFRFSLVAENMRG
jgi:signal transduction histidine kinase